MCGATWILIGRLLSYSVKVICVSLLQFYSCILTLASADLRNAKGHLWRSWNQHSQKRRQPKTARRYVAISCIDTLGVEYWLHEGSYYTPLATEFKDHVTRTPSKKSQSHASQFYKQHQTEINSLCRDYKQVRLCIERCLSELEVIPSTVALDRKRHWYNSIFGHVCVAYNLGK